MNTKLPHNDVEQEIDLVQISNRINQFFKRINRLIFDCIQFFVRNWIILSVLLLSGFGIGTYLDIKDKIYDNQIILKPNFGSVDYLYSKIDLIETKIKTNDTVFFNSIGIKSKTELSHITIEPIVDVFKFINNNEQNLEVLKLVAGSGDFKAIANDKTTVKNYPFYIVTFSAKSFNDNVNTANSLLKFFNTSSYFSSVQKVYVENIKNQIIENQVMISQIDKILNNFSNSRISNNSDKLIYNNENIQLNEIIRTKDGLLRENRSLKLDLINSDKIIKESSIATNIDITHNLNGKRKILLPVLFISFFIFFILVRRFYNKQKSLSN